MTVGAALRWARFYAVEPWGNKEAGLRTGMLAMAVGECDQEKVTAEDFVVAVPTPGEARRREESAELVAEFESWRRKG